MHADLEHIYYTFFDETLRFFLKTLHVFESLHVFRNTTRFSYHYLFPCNIMRLILFQLLAAVRVIRVSMVEDAHIGAIMLMCVYVFLRMKASTAKKVQHVNRCIVLNYEKRDTYYGH